MKLVQLSDVHIGLLLTEGRMKAILQAVRDAHPDILVSTGDLVDGRLSREDVPEHLNRMAEALAAIPAPGGKFAITGNHEFYAGLSQALEFTRKAGFTLLRNQAVPLPGGITISGVDDPAGHGRQKEAQPLPETGLAGKLDPGRYNILLKHRPLVAATGRTRFDLQLSGHVHQGQIFPFNLLVRLKFPIPCGTSSIENGPLIHVSRGSGTWGPPMRLFAPPEVTVLELTGTGPAVKR